jgi:hypothetical protein
MMCEVREKVIALCVTQVLVGAVHADTVAELRPKDVGLIAVGSIIENKDFHI